MLNQYSILYVVVCGWFVSVAEREPPACWRLLVNRSPACPADVLLDLGSATELDWRVPQVAMPMAAASMGGAPMAAAPQPTAMSHAPPQGPQ